MIVSPVTSQDRRRASGPRDFAARLLAALLLILAFAPPAAAWPGCPMTPAPTGAAAGLHPHAAASDCESGARREPLSDACFACPPFCCLATLPAVAAPAPTAPAAAAERPFVKVKRLAGRAPSLDPPPPRRT